MKKQADFHAPTSKENESVITNIPSPTLPESRPKGVHDYAHPTHITRGAAESPTDPIEDKPLVSGAGNRK
jgi:hypothetical protein